MEACENMKQRRTWQEPPVAPAPQSPDLDPQGALTQARIKEQLLKDCMEMATLPAWAAVSRADVTTCLHPHLSCLFGPMQAAAGQSLGSWTEKPIYSSPSSSALRHLLPEHWALTIVRVHPFGLNQSSLSFNMIMNFCNPIFPPWLPCWLYLQNCTTQFWHLRVDFTSTI